MPKGYKHLTYEQRCQIYALKQGNLTQKEIAETTGSTQPTISRELRRNKGLRGYRYKQAHENALQRRKQASSIPHKLTPQFISFMEKMICDDQLSPEQISGHLKKLSGASISHERIYLHIWQDKKNDGTLYKNLRRKGKKYTKRANKKAGRGLIPNRVGIEYRPDIVEQKKRVGDFEGDTIIGAGHRGAIVSIVDRKTKLTKLRLINGARAEETALAMIESLRPIKEYVHTITTDNGKEFAQHEIVATELNTKFFFANPYRSWERGLSENTNGLVRQYFPKGCDFTKLTQEQVLKVERKLNNRPRKTLNFMSPNEEFLRLTGVDLNYALHY